jgi:methylmalonyl-CoA mutase N-terminal domain/subunit
VWARGLGGRYAPRDPRSWLMRFHTQTAGVSLTAQQPHVNIVRTALEALAAVLGGTQSLHTNSFDEALALPSKRAAKIALRTQQVIASESGVADTADPLGGSYFVESLTNEIQALAAEYMDKVEGMGGSVAAIEAGWIQDEIGESAFRIQQGVESGKREIVGVNRYVEDDDESFELQTIDEAEVRAQIDRARTLRAERDADAVERGLAAVRDAAAGRENLLYPMKEALRARATLGEVSDALRGVFGVYTPSR